MHQKPELTEIEKEDEFIAQIRDQGGYRVVHDMDCNEIWDLFKSVLGLGLTVPWFSSFEVGLCSEFRLHN